MPKFYAKSCFILILLVFGFFAVDFAYAGYQKIAPGGTVTLGEFVFDDNFVATTTACTVGITNPLNEEIVASTTPMTANDDGWHYYNYTTEGNAPSGIWPSIMICGSVQRGDLVIVDKSFTVDWSVVSTSTVKAVVDESLAVATSSLAAVINANTNAVVLSASSSLPSTIWSFTGRTLNSFGTLVADTATAVWTAIARTLTGAGLSSGSLATQSDINTATSTLTATIETASSSLNSVLPASIWNTATSTFTTAGSIGKVLADNRVIKFNANGEIAAGSGDNNYKAKLYIYDLASQLVNAAVFPSITLYEPDGDVGAGPTEMTPDSTGIYSYQTTLGSGAATGRWEAVATINTGGTNPIKTSGYFEVEASPTRVEILSITDDTVSDITANFEVENEDNAGFDYPIRYCVVDTIENICDGVGEIAWNQFTALIGQGETKSFSKTLTVDTPGSYIWKVVVSWGTERSVASFPFNAVSGATYLLSVSKDGAGAGTVSSNPSGISCGSDCSESYNSGTSVTLTASASSGSTFAGWSGACSNAGSCVVSMTSVKSVIASFNTTGGGVGGGGGGGGGITPTPTPTPAPAVCSGADFNKDGIVNSVDFSILLYFWKTQPPFKNACVDINKDGKVDSVDFSIMLYRWGK